MPFGLKHIFKWFGYILNTQTEKRKNPKEGQMKRMVFGILIVAMGGLFLGCPTPVTSKSSTKAITAFNFSTPVATGTITESTQTIALTVPFGTVLTELVPTITYSGASISPASAVAHDFSSAAIYTVTAEDSSTQSYIVNITVQSYHAIIAFCSYRGGSGQIYTMNADGTNINKLTNSSGDNDVPNCAPNGNLIAYTSTRDGNHEIYTINTDGTNDKNISNNTSEDSNPSFSHDQTKIAFVSNRDGMNGIYIMNSDGTNQIKLSINENEDWWTPTWSPDNKKLAFTSKRDGHNEIYICNVDGSNQTRLTEGLLDSWAPNWSNDGKTIVFSRWHNATQKNCEICTINTDGTNMLYLTDTVEHNWSPSWSPNDKSIFFESQRDNNKEIYLMNSDGSNPQNISNYPSDSDQFPHCSANF